MTKSGGLARMGCGKTAQLRVQGKFPGPQTRGTGGTRRTRPPRKHGFFAYHPQADERLGPLALRMTSIRVLPRALAPLQANAGAQRGGQADETDGRDVLAVGQVFGLGVDAEPVEDLVAAAGVDAGKA